MPTRDELVSYARQAAQDAGFDADVFVRQIQQESGFNPNAYNPSGASGIAQIVPRWHPGVDVWNPFASLTYAAKLDVQYLRQTGSYAKALAAYNWGIGNVLGYTKSDGTVVPPWNGARDTLPGETRRYLDVILGADWTNPTPGQTVDITPILTRVLELARAEIGKPYTGPIVGMPDSTRYGDPGYDCSSFVSEMYKRATDGRIRLVPYTETAYTQCDWLANPVPGAVVFYHYRDSQGIQWPHMGLWLSPSEVLDARFGEGVGIHPHVTPVYESEDRYRRTMLPKGLADLSISPPPPPPPPGGDPPADPRDALIRSLRAELDAERTKLGVLQAQYAPALDDLVRAIRQLTPGGS